MEIAGKPAYATIAKILEENNLPTDDLSELDLEHFFACSDGGDAQGIIGLEVFETDGLLRSLAVKSKSRGRGYATALVAHLETHARALGLNSIYLLTETAESFFENLGYETLSRDKVSANIRRTKQFSSLCPDSASLMKKNLATASPV